jgi:predicted tellurium resistance membrane protein TerC
MVIAVVIAIAVMMFAAAPLANFVNANPSIIMLALNFGSRWAVHAAVL